MIIKIIGDVHDYIEDYVEHLLETKYSVQVGDMGTQTQTYDHLVRYVPPENHVFVPGNHDNYDNLPPHALGDFGMHQVGDLDFLFVRGAYSPDKDFRCKEDSIKKFGKTWWAQEELSPNCDYQLLSMYENHQPSFVITHDCPDSILPELGETFPATRTRALLQKMLEVWQPKYWIFGHWHRDQVIEHFYTTFICLDQLSVCQWDTEQEAFV